MRWGSHPHLLDASHPSGKMLANWENVLAFFFYLKGLQCLIFQWNWVPSEYKRTEKWVDKMGTLGVHEVTYQRFCLWGFIENEWNENGFKVQELEKAIGDLKAYYVWWFQTSLFFREAECASFCEIEDDIYLLVLMKKDSRLPRTTFSNNDWN